MPIRKRVLTPPAVKKIAIIGAHPSYAEAPYSDPSWEIWAMSAGMWHQIPRWNRWFELHAERTYPKYERIAERRGKKGYIEFVKEYGVTQENFPFAGLIDEFGPYFFTTGQITWLLAYAITKKPATIGIWGVEAAGEYSPQRKDIHHFVQIARDRGIQVVIPDKCPLLDEPKLYAFS